MALGEIHRVLKAGGRVILADIEHQAEYATEFAALGVCKYRLLSIME